MQRLGKQILDDVCADSNEYKTYSYVLYSAGSIYFLQNCLKNKSVILVLDFAQKLYGKNLIDLIKTVPTEWTLESDRLGLTPSLELSEMRGAGEQKREAKRKGGRCELSGFRSPSSLPLNLQTLVVNLARIPSC